MLAGLRAADSESCAALRELISGTGLPVVETFQGAGVVGRELQDHYLGRVGLFRNQPGDILISHADVLVTIGYDPVEYDPGLWNTGPARSRPLRPNQHSGAPACQTRSKLAAMRHSARHASAWCAWTGPPGGEWSGRSGHLPLSLVVRHTIHV